MKKIIVKKDFIANGINYLTGDEIKTKNYEAIIKLNEQGFIEPLEYRDLVLIKRELDNSNVFKRKEEL